MSIPVITLDFCSEPVDLHCPVCGQTIFILGVQQQCCPHLIFWSDSAAEKWSWEQQQFAHEFDQALQLKYDDVCKKGFYGSQNDYNATIKAATAAIIAAKSVTSKSAFMLSVATADIGCGGMHNGTIHAIFDYLPQRNNSFTVVRNC